MKNSAPGSIDEYISDFPTDIRKILKEIRSTIHKAVPEAEETIKYAIPTFTLNGNLIHFAAYKKHIGLYPVPRGDEAFKNELATIEGEKSTARFPLNRPIPLDLISRIVKFRAMKNTQGGKAKTKKKQ